MSLIFRSVEDLLTDEIHLFIFNEEQDNGGERHHPDNTHHPLQR